MSGDDQGISAKTVMLLLSIRCPDPAVYFRLAGALSP